MWLTRMQLNASRRGTRFLLGSPQRMHAAVLSSFPPAAATEGTQGRVLWRVDVLRDAPPTLWVSSPSKPDLTGVVEQAGWPAAPECTWQSAPMDGLLDRLTVGQRWAFRVTANPVHSVKESPGSRGRRRGHVTVAQQEQWLTDRGPTSGFSVSSMTLLDRRQLAFARRTDGAKRTVTVSTATFEGLLEVTDPDLLRRTLGHGIGRAKAYGCGLLTLAPAR